MRFVLRLYLGIQLACSCQAQMGGQPDRSLADWERELNLLHRLNNDADRRVAEQQAARTQELLFLLRASQFVRSWSKLVEEFNRKGTLNSKSAKEASRAFHRLEKTQGWPGGY